MKILKEFSFHGLYNLLHKYEENASFVFMQYLKLKEKPTSL